MKYLNWKLSLVDENLWKCCEKCVKKPVTKISLWKTRWKNLWSKFKKIASKTLLKNPVKKPMAKFWENCWRNTSEKPYENTCEQKMVEIILITEICKDAPKKLVNNGGKNHVCLYNYFTCIYMSINKTLIHLNKKKLDDLFEDICFCYSRVSCCQK